MIPFCRLPSIESIDFNSKSYLVEMFGGVTKRNISLDSEWPELYYYVLSTYEIESLKPLYFSRIKGVIPGKKSEVIDGLVTVLNNERLISDPPVAAAAIANSE